MSRELPATLESIRILVRDLLSHTRPASDRELDGAINFGYGKAIRAVSSVRAQAFNSYVDPFTIASGVTEYDIGTFDPPLARPVRLLIGGQGGARAILFRYRGMTDQEFEAQQLAPRGGNVFLYDILNGMQPGVVKTIAIHGTTVGDPHVTIADTSGLEVGMLVQIPGAGTPEHVVSGGLAVDMARPYYGTIIEITSGPSGVLVDPPIGAAVIDRRLIHLRRRVLVIAPAPAETASGRLYYNYRPAPLAFAHERLDPFVAEFRDLIVHYALSQLLRAVNDSDAQYWFEQAQEMRSELMQECDPLSGQNTEALDSALWGLGDA